MTRAGGILLLALLACGPLASRGVQPHSDGTSSMAIMPQGRNQLVRFDKNPDAPSPPDVGIAIRLRGGAADRVVYQEGQPVPLLGAFQGDRVLLETCRWKLTTCIQLTLTRVDRANSEQVALVTPIVNVPSPNDTDPPNFSPAYREAGQFEVDLKAFFELGSAPGRYAIQATIGERNSQQLHFEIRP